MTLFNRFIGISKNFRASYTDSKPQAKKIIKREEPIRVLVTGSAGQIGYSILPRIARGDIWGFKKPVILKMLDLPQCENVMHGVRMELEDCAFPTLKDCQVYVDPEAAYRDADVIVMLANSMVLTYGMPRSELLKENLKLYQQTAEYLKKYCSKDVKILMIANPANTNCLILTDIIKEFIPAENVTCLTRLDHNRTRWMVANKCGVIPSHVRRVIVWGNHSKTMYPDLRYAEVYRTGVWTRVLDEVDGKWVSDVLVPTVRDRVNAIIGARGKSSSLSAANAGIDHLKDWLVGSFPEDWVSMGVYSHGTIYPSIPKDIVFGHPCTCKDGKYTIVESVTIDDTTEQMIRESAHELLEERKSVLGY